MWYVHITQLKKEKREENSQRRHTDTTHINTHTTHAHTDTLHRCWRIAMCYWICWVKEVLVKSSRYVSSPLVLAPASSVRFLSSRSHRWHPLCLSQHRPLTWRAWAKLRAKFTNSTHSGQTERRRTTSSTLCESVPYTKHSHTQALCSCWIFSRSMKIASARCSTTATARTWICTWRHNRYCVRVCKCSLRVCYVSLHGNQIMCLILH